MSKAHIHIRKSISPRPITRLPLSGVAAQPIRRRPYLGLVAGLVSCAVIGLGVALGARGWGFFNSTSATQTARDEAQVTCERFMRLKNAGEPEALEMLGGPQRSAQESLTQAELDGAQTDYFLRDGIRIRSVARADEQPRDPEAGVRFLLVTEGRVVAPDLLLKKRHGVERSGRTMLNPDLVVEVRQGKLYGHHAELHMGR